MANGIWLNKQQIARLAIGFQHSLTNQGDGWRLEANEAGPLTTRYSNGGEETVEVRPGDYLVADADEIFVFLAERQG